MPLLGVQLGPGEEVLTPDDALERARTGELGEFTYELIAAMLDCAGGGTDHSGDRISTTVLTTKCFRSTYLERTTPYVESLRRMWAAFRGTMFHSRLEQYEGPDSIAEARYHAELPEIGPFSGSPDLVDIARGLLYDYKFVKEVPRWDKVWPDHIEQLNINRWLVDHAHTVTYKDETFDLTVPEIRSRFVPQEWQELIAVYMDDRGPKPVMAFESIDVPKKDGKGTKKQRVPAIWNDDFATNWIVKRYQERRGYFDRQEVPPIPLGFEAQGHPLCGFCAVKETCRGLEMEGK